MTDLVIIQRPLIKDPTELEKSAKAREIRQCPEPDDGARRRRPTRNPLRPGALTAPPATTPHSRGRRQTTRSVSPSCSPLASRT
jgi:hypothetical protein